MSEDGWSFWKWSAGHKMTFHPSWTKCSEQVETNVTEIGIILNTKEQHGGIFTRGLIFIVYFMVSSRGPNPLDLWESPETSCKLPVSCNLQIPPNYKKWEGVDKLTGF